MNPALKYYKLTLQHKYYVFRAGLALEVPILRLLVHDWTKLLPWNAIQYGRQFFGDKSDPLGFMTTWLRHQNTHEHHWEFWIPRTGHNRCSTPYPDNVPIRMPYMAAREMVADWVGASMAYEGKWPTKGNWEWLNENLHTIRVHPVTIVEIKSALARLGL